MTNKYYGDAVKEVSRTNIGKKELFNKLKNEIEFYSPNDISSARTFNRPLENIYETLEDVKRQNHMLVDTLMASREESGYFPNFLEEFSPEGLKTFSLNTTVFGYKEIVEEGENVFKEDDEIIETELEENDIIDKKNSYTSKDVGKYVFSYTKKNKNFLRIPTGALYNRITKKIATFAPRTEVFERQLADHFGIDIYEDDNDINISYEIKYDENKPYLSYTVEITKAIYDEAEVNGNNVKSITKKTIIAKDGESLKVKKGDLEETIITDSGVLSLRNIGDIIGFFHSKDDEIKAILKNVYVYKKEDDCYSLENFIDITNIEVPETENGANYVLAINKNNEFLLIKEEEKRLYLNNTHYEKEGNEYLYEGPRIDQITGELIGDCFILKNEETLINDTIPVFKINFKKNNDKIIINSERYTEEAITKTKSKVVNNETVNETVKSISNSFKKLDVSSVTSINRALTVYSATTVCNLIATGATVNHVDQAEQIDKATKVVEATDVNTVTGTVSSAKNVIIGDTTNIGASIINDNDTYRFVLFKPTGNGNNNANNIKYYENTHLQRDEHNKMHLILNGEDWSLIGENVLANMI